MSSKIPTILLSRCQRHAGKDWSRAPSWLGGAPRLGNVPWPRTKSGEPLHFVAQLSLADIANKIGPMPLPATGSLAFFIGGDGAVIHVPEGHTPVLPPPGTPGLTRSGGFQDWDPDGRPLFPYWPVQFSLLDVPSPPEDPDDDEEFLATQAAAIEKHFPRRKFNLTPNLAFPGPPIPDWWQNAIQLSDKLVKAGRYGQGPLSMWRAKLAQAIVNGDKEGLEKAEAAIAHFEAELAKLHEIQPGFKDYVAEVTAWTADRDPWALMSTEDLVQLEVYWKRNTEFPKLTGYHGIGGLDWLKADMLKALPTAGTEAYAVLPAGVRDLIDAHRAPRPMWWHSAISYVVSLEKAAASKSEPAAFKGFVNEMASWVAGRDPWQQMTHADIEHLKTGLEHARKEFRDVVRYVTPMRIEDVETSTLFAMLTGEEHAYASLPERVRALVNREYLLPPNVWHQMFGRGLEIQGTSSEMREEGNIMLLQLTYDDLMHWSFGDNGVYQFWIAPNDLTNRNWSAVKMTFECH